MTDTQPGQERRRFVLGGLALAALQCAAARAPAAQAQAYPSRPVKLIVPFPAGSSADLIGRTVAREISEQLGMAVVVGNHAGAGGTIGQTAVARSPADGYTIGLGTVSTLAIAPNVQAQLGYEPLRSFSPVGSVARGPFIVVVHPAVPANSLGELIEFARAKPDQLNFYSIGNGTLQHFAGVRFGALTQTRCVHVPYQGGAPALTALLAGEVQIGFDLLSSFRLRNIESGRLRALAVAGPARLPQLPTVPTAAEAGLGGFELTAWFGVVAPANTPAGVIARLNTEVQKATASAQTHDVFSAQGLDPIADSPQQFATFISTEIEKWSRIVRASAFPE